MNIIIIPYNIRWTIADFLISVLPFTIALLFCPSSFSFFMCHFSQNCSFVGLFLLFIFFPFSSSSDSFVRRLFPSLYFICWMLYVMCSFFLIFYSAAGLHSVWFVSFYSFFFGRNIAIRRRQDNFQLSTVIYRFENETDAEMNECIYKQISNDIMTKCETLCQKNWTVLASNEMIVNQIKWNDK